MSSPTQRPGPCAVAGLRRHPVLHPDAVERFVHDPRVAPLHPVVAPADHLLQPADGRLDRDLVGKGMRPGPDQPPARRTQPGQQARHGFGIVVGPARDGIDRHGDPARNPRRPSRAARRRRAAGAAASRGSRAGSPRSARATSRATARPRWPGRAAGRSTGEHGRGPVEVVLRQAAADPVDVGGVAVVGEAHSDHRLQRRRLAGGDLQAVEPAPVTGRSSPPARRTSPAPRSRRSRRSRRPAPSRCIRR